MLWDNSNPQDMARFIRASKMPLNDEEEIDVARAESNQDLALSICDLHNLNMLCHMANGFLRYEDLYLS